MKAKTKKNERITQRAAPGTRSLQLPTAAHPYLQSGPVQLLLALPVRVAHERPPAEDDQHNNANGQEHAAPGKRKDGPAFSAL